jgi:hypothetical protein
MIDPSAMSTAHAGVGRREPKRSNMKASQVR